MYDRLTVAWACHPFRMRRRRITGVEAPPGRSEPRPSASVASGRERSRRRIRPDYSQPHVRRASGAGCHAHATAYRTIVVQTSGRGHAACRECHARRHAHARERDSSTTDPRSRGHATLSGRGVDGSRVWKCHQAVASIGNGGYVWRPCERVLSTLQQLGAAWLGRHSVIAGK